MGAFQTYGPLEVDKQRVVDKLYQEAFWGECDELYPRLSEAEGLYVLSLKNGSNFSPQYVGITKRDFTKEVFNPSNLVKILGNFANRKGTLCLHLLAKPNDAKTGFLGVGKKALLWTEMFVLLLCCKKNPNISNIMGKPFLEDAGIESITGSTKGKGVSIATFRNVLGFDNSKGRRATKPKKSLPIQVNTAATLGPTTQPPKDIATP